MGLLGYRLKSTPAAAANFLQQLVSDGYLHPVKSQGGTRFSITIKGNSLRTAKVSKGITRSQAETKLAALMRRVEAVNRTADFVYFIKEVVVFGSYVGTKPVIGEIDIAISYGQKEMPDFEERSRQRAEEAMADGRRFRSFLDGLDWPRREVEMVLKNRDRALSIHSLDAERKFIEESGNFLVLSRGQSEGANSTDSFGQGTIQVGHTAPEIGRESSAP